MIILTYLLYSIPLLLGKTLGKGPNYRPHELEIQNENKPFKENLELKETGNFIVKNLGEGNKEGSLDWQSLTLGGDNMYILKLKKGNPLVLL